MIYDQAQPPYYPHEVRHFIHSVGMVFHPHEVRYIIKPQINTRISVIKYKVGKAAFGDIPPDGG